MRASLSLVLPALLLACTAHLEAQSSPGRAPSLGKSEDRVIQFARAAANHFITNLPDFSCEEHVRRSECIISISGWQVYDRLDAELLFINGQEDYRNLSVNGKPIQKGSPGDSGQWSTGEFGSMLAGVFDPATQTSFRFVREAILAGRTLRVYDYSVTEEKSNWRIWFANTIRPAYGGALWIDPQSGQVLRASFRTRSLPRDYPVYSVQQQIDYDWVTISGVKYLLPASSYTMSCFRKSLRCEKNDVVFTNYRKFEVQSQLLPADNEVNVTKGDGKKPQ